MAIDWLVVDYENKGKGIQWTFSDQLDILDFTYDIALLSHSYKEMQVKVGKMRTF